MNQQGKLSPSACEKLFVKRSHELITREEGSILRSARQSLFNSEIEKLLLNLSSHHLYTIQRVTFIMSFTNLRHILLSLKSPSSVAIVSSGVLLFKSSFNVSDLFIIFIQVKHALLLFLFAPVAVIHVTHSVLPSSLVLRRCRARLMCLTGRGEVFLSSLIEWPSQSSLLFLMMALHFIVSAFSYDLSFEIRFGKQMSITLLNIFL